MKKQQFASALVVAISAAAFVATSAQASFLDYDFVEYIDHAQTYAGNPANNQSGYEHGLREKFYIENTTNVESLVITAHGSNYNNFDGTVFSSPYAYFDDSNAGIGVCQSLEDGVSGKGKDQCENPSDDNITGNSDVTREVLSLGFDDATGISQLYFRNDGHTPVFPTGAKVFITKTVGMTATLGTLNTFDSYFLDTNEADPSFGAKLFEDNAFQNAFNVVDLNPGEFLHIIYDNQQLYLSGLQTYPVPIPAALPLFATALAGLGFAGYRRRKAKAA